jgi:small conductance mechanosensitive channel
MNNRKERRWLAGFALLLVAMAPVLAADESAVSEAVPETVPAPAVSLDVPAAEFALRLSPLTRDDLAQEAQTWLKLLKAKTQEVVELRIAIQDATGAELDQRGQKLSPLTVERRDISARLATVLDAWALKGGDEADIAPYRQYIRAVNLDQVKATGIVVLWTGFMAWLFSATGGLTLLLKTGAVLVALVLLWSAASVVSALARRALLRFDNLSDLLKNFMVKAAFWGTIGAGLMIVLGALGANLGGVLALVGGASFIIAFAMQTTLSNFAAGMMIMIYRPFDVGNFVTVAGVSGTVQAVSLVSTTITTPDNQVIVIPNSNVWGSVITNVTGNDTRRVDLVFGIGYSDDIPAAQRVLEEVVSQHPQVLEDPAPVVRLHELADSSVNFVCRPWCNTADYWAVYWDVTRTVKERFDAEGISIPFPQRDVHLHTVDQ